VTVVLADARSQLAQFPYQYLPHHALHSRNLNMHRSTTNKRFRCEPLGDMTSTAAVAAQLCFLTTRVRDPANKELE
jgi:hypothetical protein